MVAVCPGEEEGGLVRSNGTTYSSSVEDTTSDEEYCRLAAPQDGGHHSRSAANGNKSSDTAKTTRIAATTTFRQELAMLVQLAVPTCCIQLGFTIPPFLTASYVGRTFGAVALDGFQLANLVCNLFTLSLLQGLYSASDTLSPQSYGAGNYREVGLIALRGFVASFLLVVPICVFLAFGMEKLLVWFGEDPVASRYAHRWYCLYILSLPFYVIYMVTWKFLSAQHVMLPLLLASVVSCAVVLPIALEFMTTWFGFLGTAVAIVLFQASQATIAIGYVVLRHPHRPGTWPGWNMSVWRDVFHWEPFKNYFYLGLGGIIAASEWIYWETLYVLSPQRMLLSTESSCTHSKSQVACHWDAGGRPALGPHGSHASHYGPVHDPAGIGHRPGG
jgi:Na+-driven multidrug efflux pump